MNRSAPNGCVFVGVRRLRKNQVHWLLEDGSTSLIPDSAFAFPIDEADRIHAILLRFGGGNVAHFESAVPKFPKERKGGAS